MDSEFTKMTFDECHTVYRTATDPARKVTALCEMMNKASVRSEFEIVHRFTHPNSPLHAGAQERLELLDYQASQGEKK